MTMLTNLFSNMVTRRAVLKASSSVAGVIAIPTTLIPFSAVDAGDPRLAAQMAHIKAVLHRHTARSEKIRRDYVNAFARRFTEEHGLVDYKRHYSGRVGEYQLTRLFVRSLYLSA